MKQTFDTIRLFFVVLQVDISSERHELCSLFRRMSYDAVCNIHGPHL